MANRAFFWLLVEVNEELPLPHLHVYLHLVLPGGCLIPNPCLQGRERAVESICLVLV
jgi:hypothetical protein